MKAYYKIDNTSDIGYNSANKPKDGFIEYDIDSPPTELQTLFDAENLTKLIQDGEALVTAYIQAEVDKYNEANGTKFTDVHNCSNYKDATGYTHQQFCIEVWSWNVAVWEKARISQATAVASGLTAEEFLALLPKFGV